MSIGSVYQKLIRRRLERQGFKSKYAEIDSYRLHYLEGKFSGDLGTLVFVHGLGSNATSFSPIIKRVSADFSRVIAVDLVGHGLNETVPENITVDEVFRLLSAQVSALAGSEAISMYGSSLGGGFVLRFAAEHPRLIKSLALVSPAGPPLRKKDLLHIRRLFSVATPQSMKRLVQALFHRAPWYGSLLGRELKQAMSRPIVQQIVNQLEDIPALTPDEVSQIFAPILVIWGQSERVLPRRSLNWFLQHLPDQAYVEQPYGYGHAPHLENAEDLSARLLHFFRNSVK